jgi:hypothetical protein
VIRGFALAALLGLASCGYHVGGKADLVPQSVQTIAVPAFKTVTTKYRLVDVIPEEISREFRERSRFRVVKDQGEADAVLLGTINNVLVYPALADPTTGKSTSIRVVVVLTVKLVNRKTGETLYSRAGWSLHEDYEEAIDPHQFFDESGAAYDRLCKDVARDLVSAVLENF